MAQIWTFVLGSTKKRSTANPRDSVLSDADGQYFSSREDILVRQREGLYIHAGNNVGRGSDDTLFALTSGKVKV